MGAVEAVHGKEAIVKTAMNRGMIETTHPSYQAWSSISKTTSPASSPAIAGIGSKKAKTTPTSMILFCQNIIST
ncbi:hypothetical protein [Ammoniphilus sp. 3BR4]|uniref:hypothetical protein n=1 Tax=Ammoniphilus sp. 3BR4 TaxID=3158265 RepID=UPI003465B57B